MCKSKIQEQPNGGTSLIMKKLGSIRSPDWYHLYVLIENTQPMSMKPSILSYTRLQNLFMKQTSHKSAAIRQKWYPCQCKYRIYGYMQ